MILGAFGDSFLFGSDLSDIQDQDSKQWFFPSKLTYPALLADKLNFQYYCTALPAQGNKVIADDILRAVAHHGNNMLYIINWSWIDRFEYMGHGRPGECAGWCSTLPGNSDRNSEFYYKNFHSDIDCKLTNLMFIHTALNCLLEKDCVFIMTYMDELLFDKTWHCPPSVEYLQNSIQDFTTNYEGQNFLNWAKDNYYPISNNWHPLEESHQKASEYWLPKVKTLLNTHAKEDYLHAFI